MPKCYFSSIDKFATLSLPYYWNYKWDAEKEVHYSLDGEIKQKMMDAFDIESFEDIPREKVVLIMGQEYHGSERFKQTAI